MPSFLDPVHSFDEGFTLAESSLACRYVFAYLVRVSAAIACCSVPIAPSLSAAGANFAHDAARAVMCFCLEVRCESSCACVTSQPRPVRRTLPPPPHSLTYYRRLYYSDY